MTDIVVTVPVDQWEAWIGEGDLPGEPWSGYDSHFWTMAVPRDARVGDRMYVAARGRLRGYAPITGFEAQCRLYPSLTIPRACVLRRDGAVAVTIPEGIPGFRGFRYRWWQREAEVPFPDWRTA